MAAHMSALTGIVFPLGLVLGPLAIWLLKRNDSNFVGANAKEALNFQITVMMITFALVVLSSLSRAIPNPGRNYRFNWSRFGYLRRSPS